MSRLNKTILFLFMALLAGCSSPMPKHAPVKTQDVKETKTLVPSSTQPAKKYGGGYYLDDGPEDSPPVDIDSIPNATLKSEEPLNRANKPYMALGQKYVPMTSYAPYKKQGIASWYGKRYHGKKTSTGEIYDMYAMTAAHTILPLPSYVKVTNPANGKFVIVRVNDRGPFKNERLVDLSYAAAYQLRLIGQGSGLVEVEAIDTSAGALQESVMKYQAQSAVKSEKSVLVEQSIEAEQKTSTFLIGSSTLKEVDAIAPYYVQVGAFKNDRNAQLLQKRIEGLNLVENIGIVSVYNSNLYRVKLGPYSSKKEADASATNIRKQLNIPTIVSQ